jgi:DNA-binding NtrC family response regulator
MQVSWLTSSEPAPILPCDLTVMSYSQFVGDKATRYLAVVLDLVGTEAERGVEVIKMVGGMIPVWVYDPNATVASSVDWIKTGADHVATTAEEIGDLLRTLRHLPTKDVPRRSSLLGISESVKNVDVEIELVAGRRCNVLIEGETGTGKEVVAREIHSSGDRGRRPWVAVNCGAIPEPLLEAELFGHVRGAFTGAVQARAGRFEMANHGTLFLDEIGDMPVGIQAKLLRVLQEREVERLGGNERIKLDVRIIAATNVNLAQRVRDGLFRQDLYYRLNVFRIETPPLRERKEDIPLLAQHFANRFCSGERLPRKILDSRSIDRLSDHIWPGNVRELENTIEAAVILSGTRTTILPSDLRIQAYAPSIQSTKPSAGIEIPPQGLDYQRALEQFEKSLLTQALIRARGNKTAAADLLGLKRTTLAAKMRVLESKLPRLAA